MGMPAFSSIVVMVSTLFLLNLPALAQAPTSKPPDVQNPLNQRLVDAASNGNIAEMKNLIAEGADVNCCTNYGTGTPLMSAAFNHNIEAIKLLLDAGADVNLQGSQGETALAQVVKKCMHTKEALQIAELLLHRGADPNIKDTKGQTLFERSSTSLVYHCEKMNKLLVAYKKQEPPAADTSSRYKRDLNAGLVKAAGEGNIEEMKTLLAGGADVNCCKDQGTPLMLAAFHRQTQAVKSLLEHGAEVNLQDKQGQTALHQVVKGCLDHESLKTAALLLENGADITILNQDGASAWSGAYPFVPPPAFSRCQPMRQLLFKYTQKQAARLSVGFPAGKRTEWQSRLHNFLSLLAGRNDVEEIKFAIAAGADVNCCRTEGNGTPLMRAAFHRNVEAVKSLISLGADVNLQDRDGRTALHKVMWTCVDKEMALPVAEMLLQGGADLTIKDRNGRTPLDDLSLVGGCPEMQQLVRKYKR